MIPMWWRSSLKTSLERYGKNMSCASLASTVGVFVVLRVPSTPDPSGLSVVMTREDFDEIRVRMTIKYTRWSDLWIYTYLPAEEGPGTDRGAEEGEGGTTKEREGRETGSLQH